MRNRKSVFQRTAAALLAAAIMLPSGMVPASAAPERGGVAAAELREVLAGKTAPYDLMLYFRSDDSRRSRQEKAERAQREARKLLEQSDEVVSWESFYITNAIHAVITSRDLANQLAALPDVEEITWNEMMEAVEPIETDEAGGAQLFGNSIYQPDERDIEWGVLQVHADKVWEDFGIDGTGTTVGVIDGGANYQVAALQDALVPNGYKDFVDGFSTPQHSRSDDHGTHVAGTIVGEEGEKLNRIGVAPGAKLISARAMGPDGGQTADLIAAAEWMLDMKPDVINNSWGGPNDDDRWFMDVVDAWVEAGIVPVFAAGNTAEEVPGAGSISNPANYPNVLAVAAVDRDKEIGRFSNKGPSAFPEAGQKPELSAPGVQVRSVDSYGNYVSWDGTSMAAPHVTGVVALVREAAKKTDRVEDFDELDEVRDLLIRTAEPLKDENYPESPNIAYGHGLVNAYDAVAEVMRRDSVELTGSVLQDGEDAEVPVGAFEMLEEYYLGRDVLVQVQLRDDVSIRSAELTYTPAGRAAKKTALHLTSGVQNDGVYSFVIPAAELAAGTLELSVTVEDFGHHQTTLTKSLTVKPGMTLPWEQNFEQADAGLPGFIMDGSWSLSTRSNPKEPPLPGADNTTYVGINGDKSYFERRVDSHLYLPPIDLSGVEAEEHPALNVDMFNGFTGISIAKVQVSETGGGEGSWKDLHQVLLRPDITERNWNHVTLSLEEFAGNDIPLQIRFYFFGHDSDDDNGVGWYLDNLSVTRGENVAPEKVRAFHGSVNSKGLLLSFDANEETDVTGYTIQRRTGDGDYSVLTEIRQELDSFEFVYPNEETERPESHYHVTYYDNTAKSGETYTYRVQAHDFSGNSSPYSEELTLTYQRYEPGMRFDFEDSDGGFTTGAISGQANDWERGKPVMPDNVDLDRFGPLSDAWSGLLKNETNLWGTRLSTIPTKNQNSYLQMPRFTVKPGDHLYFDSFCAIKSLSAKTSFSVELQVAGRDVWMPLVSREQVMDDNKTFTWQQLEASLEDYAGEEVDIRFHAVLGNEYLDAYNLGWYIDDVVVGARQAEQQSAAEPVVSHRVKSIRPAMLSANDQLGLYQLPDALMSGTSDGTSGIPFRAKVTVLDSDRTTESSEIDGTYAIKQAASNDNEYTLRFEAYGYVPQTVTVKGVNKITVPTVYMKPARQASFSGVVTDEQGRPLEDVNVRVVEDGQLKLMTSNVAGAYSGDAYVGTYTLRFFKKGYQTLEQQVTLTAGGNTVAAVQLEESASLLRETVDYGHHVVTNSQGSYQTVQFSGGPKGMAVRFQSPHIGGVLESAEIFFVQNEYYSGDHVQVGVLTYDDGGRLVELAPFKDYTVARPNSWNTVDFSEYSIQTDHPVYVAVTYSKHQHDFGKCMGVYYDTDPTEKAKEYSFLYDGAFTSTSEISPAGSYAVRASWLYPDGAAVNPESDAGQGGGGAQPPIIDDEDAFVFDTETQTITGYRGSNAVLVIPDTIGKVAVRAIGDGAFDRTGNYDAVKLTKVVIPGGVEHIGESAFKSNNISEVSLPSTLKTLGRDAFAFQFAGAVELTIPTGVRVIPEGAFQSMGSPMKVTMPGVEKIEAMAFDGNKEIEVYAENLTELADRAFGARYASNVPYAKVFTRLNTKLRSVDNQHLINPAQVTVVQVNVRDSEDIFGQTTFFGTGRTSLGRDQDAAGFYQIGKTVQVVPADFRKDGNVYSSADAPMTVKLEEKNQLTFKYTTLAPQLREPILDTDRELVGFGLAGAAVTVTVNGSSRTVKANEDGYFTVPMAELKPGDEIVFQVNDKEAGRRTVERNTGKEYLLDGTTLLRYQGKGGSVVLPAAGDSGAILEIGAFAFYGSQLNQAILPDSVETIGTGAFLNTGLRKFGWNLKNVHQAKLRVINEYAFRDNQLTEVILPELTHQIRTGAFENNQIAQLQLGKYTAHVGDHAFKNNRLTEVTLADTAEELGVEAFMNNQITKLTVKERLPGYEDGLEEIPAMAFANNRMKEVSLPDTVTAVDETAFFNNTTGRFVVATDAEEIVPTVGYDVRRSDGTILKWKSDEKPEKPEKPDQGGSSSGGSSSSEAEAIERKISVSGEAAHAAVKLQPEKARAGDKVRVEVQADQGYQVTELLVRSKTGKSYPVTSHGNGVFSFRMPAVSVSVTPVVEKLVQSVAAFVDVPAGSWCSDAVQWAVSNGITGGVDGTHFRPNQGCTRAQAVTFLWRAAGSPAPKAAQNRFADVSGNAYYADAVLWAVENGVANGLTETAFAPDETCTRAQIVTFLWRSQGKQTEAGSNPFTDVPADAYFADAVLWAGKHGVTSGKTATAFVPGEACTRAQIVTFLYRLMG